MSISPKRSHHGSWTPALRQRFIDAVAMCGQVAPSAAICGLSRQSVYKLRARDPEFAAQWDAAVAGFHAAVQHEIMFELARSIEQRLAAGAYDPVFFDLLAEIAGDELRAMVGPEFLTPGHCKSCESMSTKVH